MKCPFFDVLRLRPASRRRRAWCRVPSGRGLDLPTTAPCVGPRRAVVSAGSLKGASALFDAERLYESVQVRATEAEGFGRLRLIPLCSDQG